MTWLQKIALYEGIASDHQGTADLLSSVIDELKPWLDREMYFKMKEMKENTRINDNWDK